MKLLYIANIRLPTEKAHGVQIMKMCEAFARLGSEVELVVPTRATAITEDPFVYYGVEPLFIIRKVAVPAMGLGKFGYLLGHVLFSLRAARLARSRQTDIVYSRDPLVLALLGEERRKAVWETHTPSANGVVRRCARAMPRIVAITEGLRSFWVSAGIEPERIFVAPDGVDLEDFSAPEEKARARTRLGLPLDKKIALYIGRIDGWKGTETLCEAAQFLSEDTQVVIIGGEPQQVALSKKRFPGVRFLGYRPYRELPDNQAAGDLLVLPSTAKDETGARYTSPLKLFTYMASGVPIIASDVPSAREILDDGSAFWFRPDDARSLADTVRYVFSHEAEAAAKAANARSMVEAYTWLSRARAILKYSTIPVL